MCSISSPTIFSTSGAYTDLEFCEKNVDDTYMTNTIAVENAVHIANALDIPLLYICTAGIFDGKKELHDDWDLPNPLGHYARSKYMGERCVVEHAKRHFICRAGWMMGGGPDKDKKFINKLIKQLVSGKKELFIVNDKDGTPTYTVDFARNVEVIVKSEKWGLYNLVCTGPDQPDGSCRRTRQKTGTDREDQTDRGHLRLLQRRLLCPASPCERLVNKKTRPSGPEYHAGLARGAE
ncbi:MAG: sugar nucleotide-binding protein [Ignavibacteriales bacterium]|nr:sugar nucleotide-binding protein [Ignavibacteriales bacterium]